MDIPKERRRFLLNKGKYLRVYEKLLPELPEVLILLLAVASDINYRFGKLNRVALHGNGSV